MLRITTRHEAGTLVLKLEGRLSGPWVAELAECWRGFRAARESAIRVELADVPFVDAAGKALLSRMHRAGVAIDARGCLTKDIRDTIVRGRAAATKVKR